jgi:hypothetical protein
MPDTKIKIPLIIIPVLFGVILLNCAGTISRQEEEKQLINSLQNEQYDRATQQFEKFKTNKLYQKKDKALFMKERLIQVMKYWSKLSKPWKNCLPEASQKEYYQCYSTIMFWTILVRYMTSFM